MRVTCERQGPEGGSQPAKRLILMRHSESEPAGPSVRDHHRAITSAGAAAAQHVARQLQERGWRPQVVLCSNALRTKQTYEAMLEVMPELEEADAHFLGSLFTTPALDGQTRPHLSEIVCAEASEAHGCVLALGHDRGWSEAASSFCGEPVRLGNSYAALLEFWADTQGGGGGSWAEALHEEAVWRLVGVLRPPGAAAREEE